MKSLTFTTITNIEQAEDAWRELSPNLHLYDNWDFRYAYYKYFNYPLFFHAAYYKDLLVGLLPLMWNPETKKLDFFAGFDYMEDNKIFTRQGFGFVQPLLLRQVPQFARLEYMSPNNLSLAGAVVNDFNYYIDLSNMKSLDDFKKRHFSTEKIGKINNQMEKITKQNIEIKYDEFTDLPRLIEFNKMRFGEQSSFHERPFWDKFFLDVTKEFQTHYISVLIDGKTVGVGIVLFHNDICYGINAGYDPTISNLGKYLTLLKIEFAIKSGARIYDAGTGAFGWKEDFHLLKKPQYMVNYTPGLSLYAPL